MSNKHYDFYFDNKFDLEDINFRTIDILNKPMATVSSVDMNNLKDYIFAMYRELAYQERTGLISDKYRVPLVDKEYMRNR